MSPPGLNRPFTAKKPSAPIKRLNLEARAAALPRKIQFGAVANQKIRVKQPLSVELKREGESVVAYCADLEEFGYGSNVSEALDDFGSTVAELFQSLVHDEPRLGDDLRRQLQRVRQYLETREK